MFFSTWCDEAGAARINPRKLPDHTTCDRVVGHKPLRRPRALTPASPFSFSYTPASSLHAFDMLAFEFALGAVLRYNGQARHVTRPRVRSSKPNVLCGRLMRVWRARFGVSIVRARVRPNPNMHKIVRARACGGFETPLVKRRARCASLLCCTSHTPYTSTARPVQSDVRCDV